MTTNMRTTSQKTRGPGAHSVFYQRTLANAVCWSRITVIAAPQTFCSDEKAMMRILILSLICAFQTGCGGGPATGPEEALRAWVDAAEAAAEDKDRRRLLGMISADYVDSRGNDHEQIGNIFRLYFLRQKSIAILTSIDDIEVMGNTAAKLSLTVGMAGTEASALGVRADAYNFELELENTDDEWVLIGARWGKVGRNMH